MKNLMSTLLLAVLIFQISFAPTLASASSQDATTLKLIGNHYGTKLSRSFKNFQSKASVAAKPLELASHQGQALILIMILTGVDLVRQHVSNSQIAREPINTELLLKHAGEAAEHIINSGEIWSSLAGASMSSGLSAKPIAIINEIIHNSSSRGLFKNILKSGIATFIMFMGWEIGGQLYREGVEMISDSNDYERGQKSFAITTQLSSAAS